MGGEIIEKFLINSQVWKQLSCHLLIPTLERILWNLFCQKFQKPIKKFGKKEFHILKKEVFVLLEKMKSWKMKLYENNWQKKQVLHGTFIFGENLDFKKFFD